MGEGEFEVTAFEEGAEVGDAAVVDVAVRAGEAPVFRVGLEVGVHVLVDPLLEVADFCVAEGADDDIGADAFFAREVAIGVGEADVGGIVGGGDADLFACGGGDAGAGICGVGGAEKEEGDEE